MIHIVRDIVRNTFDSSFLNDQHRERFNRSLPLEKFDLIKFEESRKTGRYVLTDKGKHNV